MIKSEKYFIKTEDELLKKIVLVENRIKSYNFRIYDMEDKLREYKLMLKNLNKEKKKWQKQFHK